MPDLFPLRYYQQEAVEGIDAALDRHASTLCVMPTATGKTQVYLTRAVTARKRVLVLVHRDYLITSPVERLAKAGFDDVGVEKANQRSEVGFLRPKIVFASVQTIGPPQQEHRLKAFDPNEFSDVIIDEGHRATSVIYRRVVDYFTAANPRVKVLILTATPKRHDGVAVGNVCESVAYEMTPAQAAAEGWIARPKFLLRDVPDLDFSKVDLKGVDLDPNQAAEAMLEEKPLHELCASIADFRGPTIGFCPRVDVAHAVAAMINSRYRKDRAIAVDGTSDDDTRERASKGLADGTIDYVFNVDVFTEGYDVPRLQRVVWTCGTGSLVKWTQGCGRGFRVDGSIAHLLTGGRDDSARRRQLIADSSKPFCEIITYVPSNCRHQICSAVDLLGGDALPEDVKRYAEQIQEETSRAGGGDTEEDIKTAEAMADLRKVLDQRRKQIRAEAQVRDTEYDGMGGGSTRRLKDAGGGVAEAARAVVGTWGAGEPATAKQIAWFKWKKIATPEGLTKFQASVVRDLVDLGVKPETAFGYTRPQAMKVRAEMQARREGQVA